MATDNCLPFDEILTHFDNLDSLRLENIIDTSDDDGEINLIKPSLYYSIDNLPFHTKNHDRLNILSLNAQSINSKFDSLVTFLEIARKQNVYFHAICLQETWLSDQSDLSLFQIDGYRCFSQGKRCSPHGGLITYINSQLNASVIDIENDSAVWEGLFVLVKDINNEKEIAIGNIYRPPYDNNNETNINTFVSELNPIIGNISESNRELIVAGDFNINLLHVNICNKEHFGNFLDLMLGYSLIPKITLPTRLSENSCSLIDNIFCPISQHNITSPGGIIYSTISDHFPCFVSLKVGNSKFMETSRRYVKKRVNSSEAYNALLADLEINDITNSLNLDPYCDPNQNYNTFHDHLTKLKEKHLPYKFVKFNKYRHKSNKWITHGILRSIKYRDKLYMDYRRATKDTFQYFDLKIKLASYNKLLKKTIREAKCSYYNQEFESNKCNIRKIWGTINEIICRTKNNGHGIKSILINNNIKTNDPKMIVDKFNDFFSKIGSNLSKHVSQTTSKNYRQFLNTTILTSFNFSLASELEVKKIIRALKTKTSSGHDGISVKLLKFLTPALIKPLTLIINQSLLSGIFPDLLKVAKVVPLFKKGDSLMVDNYRPISLLPSISKVFEKVVYIQLSEYFSKNKLFYAGQFGFREKHSTELATLELMDRIISALDQKHLPLSIFMDLSKAFDTLNHEILLKKLQYYGINGTALHWFSSYLINRKQYVELNNTSSTISTLNIGVPQGSILGPLLFLIYINDMPNASNAFKFILYADDSTLFSTIEYTLPMQANVNSMLDEEINRVYEWLVANKLVLNIGKTKYMIFHPYQKDITALTPTLSINGVAIEKVEQFDFLGVTLDEYINWKPQTNKLAVKLSKYSGILNKLKRYLPSHILKTLYCSLIQSHLNYAILAWGYQCGRLEKNQKRLLRIITNSKYNAHTDPLFKQLELLKLSDLVTLNALKFYYKYSNMLLPEYFYNFNITTQGAHHTHNTRQREQARAERTRANYLDYRLRIFLPSAINSLPQHLLQKKSTHSIQGFSSGIKTFLLNKYNMNCSVVNCYVCHRSQ